MKGEGTENAEMLYRILRRTCVGHKGELCSIVEKENKDARVLQK